MAKHPVPVISIGLGGIWEWYGLALPALHLSGVLPMSVLLLVDGDRFEEHNADRQCFRRLGPKAGVRHEQLSALYPTVPIQHLCAYVHRGNVGQLVTDGSVVLLSPDNHPTRRLVSDHVKTLDTCLLIVGGNDAIDEASGTDGTKGVVMVHCRQGGRDLTAPIDVYHPEIAQDTGPEPTEMSCGELLAQGRAPQVRRTNLAVGTQMLALLLRYIELPMNEAVNVAEVAVCSQTGFVVPYKRQPIG